MVSASPQIHGMRAAGFRSQVQMSANDGYRIIRPLGPSPAGPVYLAETSRGLMTICQFESPAEAGSPLWRAGRVRFLEAGRRAQALTHPWILPVLDVIDEAGEALIASEYVAGETLQSALQSRRFPVDEAAPSSARLRWLSISRIATAWCMGT